MITTRRWPLSRDVMTCPSRSFDSPLYIGSRTRVTTWAAASKHLRAVDARGFHGPLSSAQVANLRLPSAAALEHLARLVGVLRAGVQLPLRTVARDDPLRLLRLLAIARR